MKNSTLLFILSGALFLGGGRLKAQTVSSFEGMDASQLPIQIVDIDPNGAVGTKQYMQWVNPYFQAYDKTTFAPVWSTPQRGVLPWYRNGQTGCTNLAGDGLVSFDRLASRWVIAGRSQQSSQYYFCIAVSNTDDLSSASLTWYTYQMPLNSVLGTNASGATYFPDWPKIGVWSDGYYVSIDLEDPSAKYNEIGIVACVFDRQNMLTGSSARPMQCLSDPRPIPTSGATYLSHSLIPADAGISPPPLGRDEFLVSIQEPQIDGVSKTSTSVNLWDFHTDWVNPANTTLTKTSVAVPVYIPGCYLVTNPTNTRCVPEPSTAGTGQHYPIDSVGDRLMPRMDYRVFPTYESFVFSYTVQPSTKSRQTAIRWVELRGDGTTLPTYRNSGTVSPDASLYRFMPSVAQDKNANIAIGYSVSSSTAHPGIRASTLNLQAPAPGAELQIVSGAADELNSRQWGDYSSMTVDPVDECTFWYTNEYFNVNQVGAPLTWQTRIANFKVPTCQ
jgi:hypothetical protein